MVNFSLHIKCTVQILSLTDTLEESVQEMSIEARREIELKFINYVRDHLLDVTSECLGEVQIVGINTSVLEPVSK